MANANKNLTKADPMDILTNMVKTAVQETLTDILGIGGNSNNELNQTQQGEGATPAVASYAAGRKGENVNNDSIDMNKLVQAIASYANNGPSTAQVEAMKNIAGGMGFETKSKEETQKMQDAMNVLNQKLEESQNINRLLLGALGRGSVESMPKEISIEEAFNDAFGPKEGGA